MFQKVGDWLSYKSDRFIRGDAGTPASYYASSEAEQAYGRMHSDAPEDDPGQLEADAENRQAQMQPMDPFDRAGKDYGGRVPYKSQRDIAAEQQRQMQMQREVSPQYPPQGAAVGPQGYPQAAYAPPQQTYAQRPAQPQPQLQAAPQAAPQAPRQQASNVVPFPGMMKAPDGSVYAHIEYIVLLRSRTECRKVIEYIKSNASVFVSMEFIGTSGERQRCVDMLSGAAYTLGCALNRISARGIYLISSPSVYVELDPALEKVSASYEGGGFARQNYEEAGYATTRQSPYQAAAYSPGGYRAAGREPASYDGGQAGTSRFARAAQGVGYSQPSIQNTERRAAVTFGGVMAGDVTGAYQPASAYRVEDGQTGRYPSTNYQQ